MVKYLLSPFTLFVLLVFLACVLFVVKKIRPFKIVSIFALLILVLAGSPFLPYSLVKSLEGQYPRTLDISSLSKGGPYHILVLGAGHSLEPGLPAIDQLNPNALVRLAEGIGLYRLLPGSRLIVSGNSISGRTSQAQMLADAAISLGVPPGDILMQEEPANTYAEAQTYAKKFSRMGRQLIIVTAAFHMPRAMYLFRSQGLNPIAAPTAHLVKLDPHFRFQWRLALANMKMAEVWTQETAGLLHARHFLLSKPEVARAEAAYGDPDKN